MENKFEEDYIERYVKKVGLLREKNPKSFKQIALDKVNIFVNFGDLPSTVSFGSTVFPQILNQANYNVVLTWKGAGAFFPTADEVWYLDKGYILGDFYSRSKSLTNDSPNIQILMRSLNEHFMHVCNLRDYKKYFTVGVTNQFLNDFKTVKYKPCDLLTLIYLNPEFRNQFVLNHSKACVILPFKQTKTIDNGSSNLSYIDQFFYKKMVESLIDKNWFVYCLQNALTYDISSMVESENLIFIKEVNYHKILSMINHVGMYVDFFADMGIMGLLARSNVFRICARSYYFQTRKYLEDMIYKGNNHIKNYFSFLYFGRRDADLNDMFFESIIKQLDQFFEYVQEQKVDDKTVLEEKEINLAEISKMYIKKLSPKFISLCKETKK